MTKIRITKRFEFEMAHVLLGYDGPCKNIHGHSYRLYVTVSGQPLEKKEHPKNGMVMDFDVLSTIIHRVIIDEFDHGLALNADTPKNQMNNIIQATQKIIFLPYQPTCENLITDISNRIKKELPAGISLHSLKLHETESLFAEWFADDN